MHDLAYNVTRLQFTVMLLSDVLPLLKYVSGIHDQVRLLTLDALLTLEASNVRSH